MWMIVSFVIGIIMEGLDESVTIFLMLSIFFFLILSIFVLKFLAHSFNMKDGFLFFIPIMLVFGLLLAKNQRENNEMDIAFDDKSNGSIVGTVSMIVNKGEKSVIYLKNNTIILGNDFKTNMKAQPKVSIKINMTENLNQNIHQKPIINPYKNQNSKIDLSQNRGSYKNLIQSLSQNMGSYKNPSQNLSSYKNPIITNQKQYYSKKIIVYTSQKTEVRVGNVLRVDGTVMKFEHASNLGQFDEYDYNKRKGIDYKVFADNIQITDDSYSKVHRVLQSIKDRLIVTYEQLLEEKEAGILLAMLLGEKYLLDGDIKILYQENGIAHILAISGLHVSLIGLFVYNLLKKAGIGQIKATLIGVLFIFSYGLLTNFSISTNRAVVMLVLSLMAKVIGKTYDLLTATALSGFIILLGAPLQLYDGGFLLSFGAIMSIAVLLPVFKQLNLSFDSLLTSISVTLMTIPIILYFFFEIPTYAIILNLIIIPLMSLVIILGLLGGIVGTVSVPIGVFFIGGSHYILILYEKICQLFVKLPYNMIVVGKPHKLLIVMYYIIIAIFVFAAIRYGKKRSLMILLLLVIIFIKPQNKGLKITFLDVGQGDGIFFQVKRGKTFLLDGGSTNVKQVGKYRLIPFFKASGFSYIDYALVTHADSDHISGIIELVEEKFVRCLVLSDTNLKDDAYMNLVNLAKAHHIEVVYLKTGDQIIEDELKITCIHPSLDFYTDSRNATSLVLDFEYGEFSALLTGDLEGWVESEIIHSIRDYDLLKVAHHGSKHSTYEEFLEIVKPEIAIISCGKGNSYKHPHEELIDRLKASKSEIYITKDMGAITVESDGKEVEVSYYIPE